MDRRCRADLHVHSLFSDTPSSRFLRRVGCPESFTSPRAVYDAARRRGMDLVTITDHNTIDGALEIADLPGTFVSIELSTRLPETGARLHVVALDVAERQAPDLLSAREDLYELVRLMRSEGIVHFIAHPLFDFDRRLDVATVEKLVLLFDVFEVRNGARAERYNDSLVRLLRTLTPAVVETLADRHGIEPHGDTPWHKAMVGGSDDHSGFFIARAFTEAQGCSTVADLLMAIREGRTTAGGEHGDALTLAHNIWGIGYRYAEERLGFDRRNGYLAFFNTLLDDLIPEPTGDPSELERARLAGELSFADVSAILRSHLEAGTIELGQRIPTADEAASSDAASAQRPPGSGRGPGRRLLYSGGFRGFARSFVRELDREAQLLLGDETFLSQSQAERANRRVFAATGRLADRLMFGFAARAVGALGGTGPGHARGVAPRTLGGSLRLAAGHLSAVGLVHFLAFPYYYAYHSQNRSKELLEELAEAFPGSGGGVPGKVAVFVDVLDGGEDAAGGPRGADVARFAALGPVTLPGLGLTLAFPPVLQVIDLVDREQVGAVHVVTQGPLGLLGVVVARLLHLPLTAEYGPALPIAVRRKTADGLREELSWRYLARFCRTADEIVVSAATADDDVLLRRLARDELPLAKVVSRPSWATGSGTEGPGRGGLRRPAPPGSRSTRR
jgi:hypothetical protein